MNSEPVIYTDGHGVKVTPVHFITGDMSYLVSGIVSVRMITIKPNRDLALILMIIGLAGIALGMFHFILPAAAVSLDDTTLTPNDFAIMIGGIFLVVGVIWGATARDKYTVRITTAEGDKDVIVSNKRDYVKQIVTSLIEAGNINVLQ